MGETAKIAYSTKLPEEQVAFLRSLANAAAWLSEVIADRRERETVNNLYAKALDAEYHRVENRLPAELHDAQPMTSEHWDVLRKAVNIRHGYYIPDAVLVGLQNGSVHHLEHDGHSVTAIYLDGRREAFDSTITPEIAAADRKRWIEIVRESGGMVLEFTTTVQMRQGQFHRVMTGWTK